jgi:hypothetical protein
MFFARTIDFWIPLAGGLMMCWVAYRPIPVGPKQAKWEAWHARWGRFMRIGGPLLVLYGAVRILVELMA